MAIKITGTTVINDSREIENVNDINRFIQQPEITSPADGDIDVALDVTIQGTPYSPLYTADTRDYREFQVDLQSGDFSTPERSNQVDSDSWVIDPILDPNESYKIRIRDVSVNGTVSEWSEEVAFTSINTFVDEPTVSVEDGPSVTATTVDQFGPKILGEAVFGGFYMGTIAAAGTTYYLVVAPNATGCACCDWATSQSSTPGACSDVDGYANTYQALESSTYPAGNWTATRTIDGFSDWYLPAIDELQVFYNNGGGNGAGDPLPSGEDFNDTDDYWSSTEFDSSNAACYFKFSNGIISDYNKVYAKNIRAARRVPI